MVRVLKQLHETAVCMYGDARIDCAAVVVASLAPQCYVQGLISTQVGVMVVVVVVVVVVVAVVVVPDYSYVLFLLSLTNVFVFTPGFAASLLLASALALYWMTAMCASLLRSTAVVAAKGRWQKTPSACSFRMVAPRAGFSSSARQNRSAHPAHPREKEKDEKEGEEGEEAWGGRGERA